MKPHFLAKLNEGKGPSPAAELRSILEQAGRSPDRTAWFATRTPGREWGDTPDGGTSIALVFHTGSVDESIELVGAKVLERRDQMPDDPIVRDLYSGHEGFKAWWRVMDPFAVRIPSLNAIPGTSREKKTAQEAFVGQLAFAYWELDDFDQVRDRLLADGCLIAPFESLAEVGLDPRPNAVWKLSSPEQRAELIRQWAAADRPPAPTLSDEALLRESIYP